MSGDNREPSTEQAEAIRRVRDDREHGASWLAREAARALAALSQPGARADAGERLARLRAAARAFVVARPSMAAVANTAARVWASAAASPVTAPEERLRAAHDTAQSIIETWGGASATILTAARPLLGGTILTHSRSGTVEDVLSGLVTGDGGIAARVIVTESRPGGEGVALARALAAAGWDVTLIADAACGHFMPSVHAVVLGADSVRDDGSTVNKIGSYPIALAARDARVPVYVLCEILKIAAPGFPLVYEEMDPRELLPDAPPGVTPRNIYFDRTPTHLVSRLITEAGALVHDDVRRLAVAAGVALDTLSGD